MNGPKKVSPNELEQSRALLETMGFEFASAIVPELAEQSVREKQTQLGFLNLVLDTERSRREERRVKTALRLSGLPVGKTLESFDFVFQPSVDKAKVDLLATCEFARRRENVLLLGPPGVGKSHLATALGVQGVQNGFSVTHLQADELIEMLRKDDESGRRIHRRRYMSSAVLVIDELGFQALDRRDELMSNLVFGERVRRRSCPPEFRR